MALLFLVGACNNKTDSMIVAARTEVKNYTAEQLYTNKSIGGVAFNADESKILVNANMSGIYNLYELNISDTLLKPLTNSTKESFFGIDYKEKFTDEASVVEAFGLTVSLVEGDDENIKITNPQDLVIAEAIIKNKSGVSA